MTYKHTVEIKEYNKWLIITILNYNIKIKNVGVGLLFSDFNRNDLHISSEALSVLKDNLNVNIQHKDPVLEIISMDRMWWASNQGIIIPPNEYFHIYTIPNHTLCKNDIDEKIKNIIDNKKIIKNN